MKNELTVVGTTGTQGKTHAAEVTTRAVLQGVRKRYMRLCDGKESPNGAPLLPEKNDLATVQCAGCKKELKARSAEVSDDA